MAPSEAYEPATSGSGRAEDAPYGDTQLHPSRIAYARCLEGVTQRQLLEMSGIFPKQAQQTPEWFHPIR
ncbi:MAG: hypothetical protein UHD09_07140 [Bifidobacterium sp.]|nr:hypothetical protein [Bifidobacterium sp.]